MNDPKGDMAPSEHQRRVWEGRSKAHATLPRLGTVEDHMGAAEVLTLRAYELGKHDGLNRAAELITQVLDNPDFEVIDGAEYPYDDKMGDLMKRIRILKNMLDGRDPRHGIL
jgi:hypothetical protein